MPGCSHTWHRTVRFLLRQEEMNEIDGDIMVGVDQDSCCQLQTSGSNEKAWVWSGEVEWESLALEFPSRHVALKFKEIFELVHELNMEPLNFWQRDSCRGFSRREQWRCRRLCSSAVWWTFLCDPRQVPAVQLC